MIEVEYEGPRLRGLAITLMATTALLIILASGIDSETVTPQVLGIFAVALVGVVVLEVDIMRWRRQQKSEDEES